MLKKLHAFEKRIRPVRCGRQILIRLFPLFHFLVLGGPRRPVTPLYSPSFKSLELRLF